MTLRTKLGLSLLAAALLPMGVAVGVPLLQAGHRARQATGDRLEQIRRQADDLVAEHRDDTAARVARAASDLEADRDARRFLRQGTAAAGTSIARSLAGAVVISDSRSSRTIDVTSLIAFSKAA